MHSQGGSHATGGREAGCDGAAAKVSLVALDSRLGGLNGSCGAWLQGVVNSDRPWRFAAALNDPYQS